MESTNRRIASCRSWPGQPKLVLATARTDDACDHASTAAARTRRRSYPPRSYPPRSYRSYRCSHSRRHRRSYSRSHRRSPMIARGLTAPSIVLQSRLDAFVFGATWARDEGPRRGSGGRGTRIHSKSIETAIGPRANATLRLQTSADSFRLRGEKHVRPARERALAPSASVTSNVRPASVAARPPKLSSSGLPSLPALHDRLDAPNATATHERKHHRLAFASMANPVKETWCPRS